MPGRPLLRAARNLVLRVENRFDGRYLSPDVRQPRHVAHEQWQNYLSANFNRPGVNVLEVGSREVTGQAAGPILFSQANYTGFDYYPGKNVDVVGDAHQLAKHFEPGHFDLIYSSACFEHFAMPWVVAQQMGALLKTGGSVFVETHFSFSSHERPWNFFQFSDMGLKALFSPAMGFECIDAGMSNPIVGRFSKLAAARLRNQPVAGLYCHSEFLGRKVSEAKDFSWSAADVAAVVSDTEYPKPCAVP